MEFTKEQLVFWNEFLKEKNLSADTPCFEVFCFGDSKELVEELTKLILIGKKKATASSIHMYDNPPKIGDYSLVTNWEEEPILIIKTTNIRVIPFNELTFDIVKAEGEDENLKSWQDNHKRYYKREGEKAGYTFTEDMEVIFENFEIVYIKEDYMNYTILGIDYENPTRTINLVAIHNKDKFILVDTSYQDSLEQIENRLKENGLDFNMCEGIVITHHDFDHIGSLREIIDKYPHIKVYSSKTQEPYINGEKVSLRIVQREAMYDSLPEEEKENAKKVIDNCKRVRPANVDIIIKDGDILDWGNGIEVIETSGHMPEHISLYIKDSKTLISGDALWYVGGKLGLVMPEMCMDIEKAYESVEKLMEYDIEEVICTHGGIVKGDIKNKLKDILINK